MDNYFQMDFTPAQVNAISNLGLAHVGDGAYELMCRAYLCKKGDQTVLMLHRDTVQLVKAPTQAKFAQLLQPHLTQQEQDFFRRGKNAHTHAAPKAATRREYALATGLETLFGALYLMGSTERLNELFQIIIEEIEHGI
ncbi:MAG: ribonuclease III [Oscillospiraceae bacterium]|nr:ribonuclease III [Oscillospiraceae bacterium]